MSDAGSDGEAATGVDVGAITTAPREALPTEAKSEGQNPLTGQPDPNLLHHLGLLGKFTGGGPEKAGNIAFVVIIAAFIVLICAALSPLFSTNAALAPVMDKLVTGCLALITGALGYIFGSRGNGSS